MRRTYLFFVVLVFFAFVDIDKAFAFGDGLLADEKGYTITRSFGCTDSISNLYDNDINTGISCANNTFVRITFDKPIKIKYAKIFQSTRGSRQSEFYVGQDGKKRLIRYLDSKVENNISINSDVNYIEIRNPSTQWNIMELEVYSDEYFYLPVESLSASISFDHVVLSWLNPNSIDFELVEVYENGVFKKNVLNPLNTTKIDQLKPNTDYAFKAIAVYKDGGKSIERTVNVRTDDLPEDLELEVINLKATTKHDRVDLSWTIANPEVLQHVNIYREEIKETETGLVNNLLFGRTVKASSKTKIFETNGTYFNDLTVKPESKYEYTLTTQTTFGTESEGVSIMAVTKSIPLPEIEGGGYEEQENGDYLFSWTSPTTGQVKVLIDGQEYKTVDASLKQILIPAADMKYDLLGNPKVSLVPISESGKEGKPKKPGSGSIAGTELPFGPTELLKSTFGLLGVLGPFILLVLAIYLVPKITNVIVAAVQKQRNERRM